MLKNRVKLEEELKLIIDEINMKSALYNTKKIKENMMYSFIEKGIMPDEMNDIFASRIPLETLSQIDLCIFTIFLYNEVKNIIIKNKKIKDDSFIQKIEPNRYFSEIEINKAKEFKIEAKEIVKYPIVIPGVKQLNENQWYTSLSAQQIVELYNKKVVIYDPEMQRALKTKKYKDKIIGRIDINRESVTEIKELIIIGQFVSNFITFNILENGEEEFFINENGDLQINMGKYLITDGFHRSLGIIEAVNENPDLKFNIGVMITHFDKEKVGKFIVQEDKRNPIDKEHINELNVDRWSNIIVSKLNEGSKSHLKNKIITDKILIKAGKGLLLFSTLSDSIDLIFQPKGNKDTLYYSKVIMNGFNLIIENNIDLLDMVHDDRLWISYLLCIKNAINADNFEDKLLEFISNINENNIVKISYNTVNQSLINRIEKELSINV